MKINKILVAVFILGTTIFACTKDDDTSTTPVATTATGTTTTATTSTTDSSSTSGTASTTTGGTTGSTSTTSTGTTSTTSGGTTGETTTTTSSSSTTTGGTTSSTSTTSTGATSTTSGGTTGGTTSSSSTTTGGTTSSSSTTTTSGTSSTTSVGTTGGTTTNSPSGQITVTSAGNIEIISNGKITLQLVFKDKLLLKNNVNQDWTQGNRLPYIDAAKKWLSALAGIENQTNNHVITIDVSVKTETRGLGVAAILTKTTIGEFDFPTKGELIISNDAYVTTGDEAVPLIEFNANILHEIGHVIGIGELTENFTTKDATYGNVFKATNSKAVQFYQEIYGVSYNFVPMSDNGAHLYDNVSADDVLRLDNTKLPPLTKEFMANGQVFGKVTFGVLDDIGYIIDYNHVTTYTK